MGVNKKSVLLTSFDRGRFNGNLFSFENKGELQISYLMLLIRQISFFYRFLHSCSKIVDFGL